VAKPERLVAAYEAFFKRQREKCGWDLSVEGTSDWGSSGGGTLLRIKSWWF